MHNQILVLISLQWFGNLVTMSWWEELWLNEGFASYVEYFGMNATEPDWKVVNVDWYPHSFLLWPFCDGVRFFSNYRSL